MGVSSHKNFAQAISQKPKSIKISYLVETLTRGCRDAALWYDLDLTFYVAIMTLFFKSCQGVSGKL